MRDARPDDWRSPPSLDASTFHLLTGGVVAWIEQRSIGIINCRVVRESLMCVTQVLPANDSGRCRSICRCGHNAILYTEDLQHGQRFENLPVANPFH